MIEFFYLVGYWIGDGFYRSNQGYHQFVLVGNHDDLPKVKAAARKLGYRYEERPTASGKHWDLIPGKAFNNALFDLGVHPSNSRTKRLPPGWQCWTKEQKWVCLEGLIDSDGTVGLLNGKSASVTYATVGSLLANDVQLLFEDLGLRCSNRAYEIKTKWNDSPLKYYVRMSSRDNRTFAENVTLMPKKQKNLLASLH